MRRVDWILPGFSLLFCGTVAFSATGPTAGPDIAERIKAQEARVPRIEAVAAQGREEIERWYKMRRAEAVQEIARPAAARLSLAEREQWVQYADLYLDRFYAPAYFDAGFTRPRMALLGQAMVQEYLISEMANLLASEEFERKLTQVAEERLEVSPLPFLCEGRVGPFETQLLPLLRDQAQQLLVLVQQVRTELGEQVRQLDYQRKARLDGIMNWENDLKEHVRGILEYLRQSESRPVQLGVVESVGYCPAGGYFCIIEGVDRPLGIGETVGKVRIVKIDQEKVAFAKDGTTWTQELGAAPQPYWD
ncbi:MAG: hypothetical protein M1376_23925 [Planctomycetes bacterium]|nr:hypothetical protein [Planctomycetota bacterium]